MIYRVKTRFGNTLEFVCNDAVTGSQITFADFQTKEDADKALEQLGHLAGKLEARVVEYDDTRN